MATDLFAPDSLEQDINIPLMEKVKLIDSLQDDEQNTLIKMIDLAIANKRMKDSLQAMIAS